MKKEQKTRSLPIDFCTFYIETKDREKDEERKNEIVCG